MFYFIQLAAQTYEDFQQIADNFHELLSLLWL